MKLWILRPVEPLPDIWDPWYDKCFGMVVRAKTEAEARKATEIGYEIGCELADNGGDNPWLDPLLTSCTELSEDGPEEVILSDFHSA